MTQTSKPSITSLESNYVNDALDASDVGVGEFVGRFEGAWADYNKMKYGVACNSGTSALLLALLALDIKVGDEVIVPEYTMVATAFAVTQAGATPVFVDCLEDLTVDPNIIQEKITSKTKAIMIVPIYGRNVSPTVYNVANDNGLYIIEDMAEAHGIMPKGDIACYSFHGSKILTTGGGGMCLTNSPVWADEMRLRGHLYLDSGMSMLHEKLGYNFRLSNIQAAIGLAQVERINEILKERRKVEGWYNKLLPTHLKMPQREVVWVYDINCGDKQEEIKEKLYANGIECRYGFKPMSMQPMYEVEYEHLEAYKWSKRVLYIPLYPELSLNEVKKICTVLRS